MASRDPLIVAGENIVDLLRNGKYSISNLRLLIENLEEDAGKRSSARVETHRPDEWQKIIHVLWRVKSALEDQESKGSTPDPRLAASLSDALKGAEARRE
jgi:hypothetical protein